MSYSRYRKRDKSEINRKSEIGLGRVENYDSADISENVIHHVRDYLYTPLYIDLTTDRVGSYGIVKFLEAGHTMFITSLNTVTGASRDVYDTLSGELVYDKPTGPDDIKSCPVNFKILGNYDTSRVFTDAVLTVTVYQERLVAGGPLEIVTYVGIGMDGLRPFGKHGIRAIGTNLHDYTLGAVDYVNSSDPYDRKNQGYLAQWTFKISDQIKRELIAVPLYSEVLGDYVYSADGENYQSGAYDTATINGVPFCGVHGLTIDGKDARHITVAAKHEGSDIQQAGEHQWNVLKSYPYLKYNKESTKHKTINNLSQTNSLSDKGGLCYLSDFDDAENQSMSAFLDTLGYWLTDSKKDENLSVSSVITVGILRRFWKTLEPLLDTSSITNILKKYESRLKALEGNIAKINERLDDINGDLGKLKEKIGELSDQVIDIGNRDPIVIIEPVEPPVEEPTEISKTVYLTLDKGSISFESPNGPLTGTLYPTGTVYQNMSNGTTNNLGNTTTLKYQWNYTDSDLKIQIGDVVLSERDYLEVGDLTGGLLVNIEITNLDDTDSFSARELKFFTKYDDSHVAEATLYVSYSNNNITTHGALIDMSLSDTYLDDDHTSSASYYSIGSTVEFYMSCDDLIANDNNFTVYLNQVASVNGTLEKEDRYAITLKTLSEGDITTITEDSICGQGVWALTDKMETPGVNSYSKTFDLYYNQGQDFFMRVIFNVGPMDPYLDIDKYSITFGASDDTVEEITATSNFNVTYNNQYDWINVEELSDKSYAVSVDSYSDAENTRTGYVEFTNEAGQSKNLKVTQGTATKFIYVIKPESILNYHDYQELTCGSSWQTTHTSPDPEVFSFVTVSNISYDIYLNDEYLKSYSSSGGSYSQVSVDLPANQTRETMTHKIEVRSDLGVITLSIIKAGQEDKATVSSVYDNVFHKEDAFDILRTEKILTVSCENPDQVTLAVTDNDLIAKIYAREDGKVYIHCHPKTVKVWSSDKTVSLNIYYNDSLAKKQDFIIEATTDTVGRYFNVSSTIESFVRSDVNDQKITITAFSMAGTLSLETADNRSSLLRIGDKQSRTIGSWYSYNTWDVIIPKGLVPASKTPWTLKLTNTLSGGSSDVKYISIYEASDVSWGLTYDFQLTAFGHLSIADGCEIMPLIYERRQMTSYIGTNDSPTSTVPKTFFVPYIVHDLDRCSLGNYDYWTQGDAKIVYSTCPNGEQISSDTHNAITATLDTNNICVFSNSLDTNFYNDQGITYTSVYGSEYIYSDTQDSSLSRYVLLPSSMATINGICMQISNPIKYMTNERTPNFLPVPPDWCITTDLTSTYGSAISSDGYLTIPTMSGKTSQSFSYTIDSTTNWGTKTTNPHSGKYLVTLYRSDLVVVDEVPEYPGGDDTGGNTGDDTGGNQGGGNQGDDTGGNQGGNQGGGDTGGGSDNDTLPGTVIYDQQNPNNDGLLKWSGFDLLTMNVDTVANQPKGSRHYFNYCVQAKIGSLDNVSLSGVPNGSKIVTTLNSTFNCADCLNFGYNGTSTASGYYSETAFNDALFYDLERGEVWDSQSFSGWSRLHSKHRRATFLTDGIGQISVTVKASRGLTMTFGMAGVCEASSNSTASSLMFVPYVKVSASTEYSNTKKTTNYFFVKSGVRFGLGFQNAHSDSNQFIVECLYQMIREVVDSRMGYYKYNLKISSDGTKSGGGGMDINSNGIPNLLLEEASGMYTYKSSNDLDFEITHEDMCNIINYHLSSNSSDIVRTDNRSDDTPWYFYGTESGYDKSVNFAIQPYTWLRDLKVKVTS